MWQISSHSLWHTRDNKDKFLTCWMTYPKYYAPSEHLAVDKAIASFKGWVIFKQYIPKKHKWFGIKIYKLCDMSHYKYDMDIYLGKVRTCVTRDTTAAHASVKQLRKMMEWNAPELYIGFSSSPNVLDDLTKQEINCCGTVKSNRKGMPQNLPPWNKWLKPGDIHSRTRDDWQQWSERQTWCINMHKPTNKW